MSKPLIYGGEPMYEYVLRQLKDNKQRGQWRRIARETGISMNTIIKIGQQIVVNPRVANIQILADYFLNQDAQANVTTESKP